MQNGYRGAASSSLHDVSRLDRRCFGIVPGIVRTAAHTWTSNTTITAHACGLLHVRNGLHGYGIPYSDPQAIATDSSTYTDNCSKTFTWISTVDKQRLWRYALRQCHTYAPCVPRTVRTLAGCWPTTVGTAWQWQTHSLLTLGFAAPHLLPRAIDDPLPQPKRVLLWRVQHSYTPTAVQRYLEPRHFILEANLSQATLACWYDARAR